MIKCTRNFGQEASRRRPRKIVGIQVSLTLKDLTDQVNSTLERRKLSKLSWSQCCTVVSGWSARVSDFMNPWNRDTMRNPAVELAGVPSGTLRVAWISTSRSPARAFGSAEAWWKQRERWRREIRMHLEHQGRTPKITIMRLCPPGERRSTSVINAEDAYASLLHVQNELFDLKVRERSTGAPRRWYGPAPVRRDERYRKGPLTRTSQVS